MEKLKHSCMAWVHIYLISVKSTKGELPQRLACGSSWGSGGKVWGMGLEERQEKRQLFVECAFPFVNFNFNFIKIIHVDTWDVKLCHEAYKNSFSPLLNLPSLIVSPETNPLLLAPDTPVCTGHFTLSAGLLLWKNSLAFTFAPAPHLYPLSLVREPFLFKNIFSLYMIKIK